MLLAVGVLRGIGGGARGFSKLVSWLEGKRGLVGGLVMVERCECDCWVAEFVGVRRLNPDTDGSSALA